MTLHQISTPLTTSAIDDLRNIKRALDESSIVAITNKAGMITYVNEKFCSISQFSEDELIGKTHRIINSGYHPKSFFQNMWATILAKKVWQGEVKNRAKDGSEYWTSTTIVPFLDSNGEINQFISIRQDITARVKAEEELAEALRNDFQHVVRNMEHCVFKLAKNEKHDVTFTLSEGRLAEALSLTSRQVYNRTIQDVFPSDILVALEPAIDAAMNGNYTNVQFSYQDRQLALNLSPITNDDTDDIFEIVGALRDITEQHVYEHQIYRIAHFDALTNLPNRTLFAKKLHEAIQHATEQQSTFGILFIDLNNFKQINDSYGHSTGDRFLQFIADTLKLHIRKKDFLARFGGDKFLLLIEDIDEENIEYIGKRLVHTLDQTFEIGHLELHTAINIGISMFPKHSDNAEMLLQHANNAMQVAKKSGSNRYQLFNPEIQMQMQRKLMLETALNDAIKKDQMLVYYQPKLCARTKNIIGAEALLRWNHPVEGIISPGEFIPIAEKNGLIIPIGQWVLAESIRQAKIWSLLRHPITVSVNVSILQMTQTNFVAEVSNLLKQHKLEPHLLNLEITESLTTDIHFMTRILNELKEIGVYISIDDFGTGYSSLRYLSQLPIHTVKIDQSFIRDLTQDNQSIIKTIIQLAHAMNLSVVAEGVETEEQEQFLVENLCHELQGYLYSRPMPLNTFQQFLDNHPQQKTI
ncbi:EAL domain-containing protein [Caryophanon latum]|nr:EAL domain-containing protein [Caryophanon latum]